MGSIYTLHQTGPAQRAAQISCNTACPRHAYCLLSGVGIETRRQLERLIGRPKILQRGQRLFTAGKTGDDLYLINSGSFKAYVDSDSGEEQITGFHFASDLLGFDAMESGKHTYTVEVLETASVCCIPFADLQYLARNDLQLNRLLLKKMCRQLGDERRTIFMLGRMSAEQRLAHFFLKLSAVMQECGCVADQINLSMPRHDIANYLGLALETVSRLLHRFQNSGLLQVAHRDVQLLNVAGLQQIVRQGEERLARAH
ncbi:MAG TPA: helix-turn-helix domain-containing protein [Gammaproteobacteria bacterium]